MRWPFKVNDRVPRRHDLAFVAPAAWRALLDTRADLAREPLIADWVDRGWPLVVRRVMPGEPGGLPLGLPLPPAAGKRRLSFFMRPRDVARTQAPPTLDAVLGVAPPAWRPTLQRLAALAASHGVEARVFGSLAWHALTGLDYLTAASDLDLLLSIPRAGNPARLAVDLAAIARTAPMRLDGEFVREDGAGVNWREVLACHPELLVKTQHGVELLPAASFLAGVA